MKKHTTEKKSKGEGGGAQEKKGRGLTVKQHPYENGLLAVGKSFQARLPLFSQSLGSSVEMLTGGSGQVLWTCTGRNTLSPFTSLPVMGEIAGVNTASLGVYLHSTKTRARWAEGFHDELRGHVFDLERDGLRQVVLYLRLTMR